MNNKPKILISVYCIKDIGGISTAICNLLNEIHELYDVSLIVPCNYISKNRMIPADVTVLKGSDVLRDVAIERNYLSYQSSIEKIVRNVRRLANKYIFKGKLRQRALDRIKVPGSYDAAIAFADEHFTEKGKIVQEFDYKVVLNGVTAKRKAAWIHNDPNRQNWTRERCLAELSTFDAVVNVSEDCKRLFDAIIPEFRHKSKVVYNTYNIADIKAKAQTDIKMYPANGNIHFVTVGRVICGQKAMNRIVDVCKRLKDEGFANFDWTIVGEGADRPMLAQRTVDYGLSEIIRFVGLKPNPYPFMKQADAFVLVSRWEGLSMTNKEAQILETPTLITRYGAAEEAVENGKQGLICDNSTEGVYTMMKQVLEHPEELSAYRKYLRENPVTNEVAIAQFREVCGI